MVDGINGHNKRVGYVNNEYARVLIGENEEERIFKIDVCEGCKDAAADAIENNAPDSQDVNYEINDALNDDDVNDYVNNDTNPEMTHPAKKQKKEKKEKKEKKQKKN